MDTQVDWHLDRRVPLTIICALIGWIIGAGWWASAMDGRMVAMELAGASRQARLEAAERNLQTLNIGAATVSAQLKSLDVGQQEIKDALKEQSGLIRDLRDKSK